MGQRVFVLGIDGLCEPVWKRLVAQGLAPSLTRLVGHLRSLQSTTPAHSAPAWTSIATGLNPGRHGVLDFWQRTSNLPASWRARPLVTRSNQPFFWEIASRQGASVGIFNYPLSYPPRPVPGYWVCGLNTPARVTDFVLPRKLAEQLSDFQVDLDVVGLTHPHKGRPSPAERRKALRDITALARNHFQAGAKTIAATIDQNIQLYAHVITATDRLLHLFWDVMSDPHDPLWEGVAEFWAVIDRGVHHWLDLAQPDAILLVSDHGFSPGARMAFNASLWLESLSIAPSLNSSRRPLLAHRISRFPQLKAMLKRLLPTRNLSAIRTGLEADSLSFYALHSPVIPEVLYGPVLGVTLNVRGRQPNGMLSPQQAEDLIARLIAEAISLRDGQGAPIFRSAKRAIDIWWGEYLAFFPDVVLELQAPYGGAVGSADHRLLIPALGARTGDHHETGILGSNQPLPVAAEEQMAVWDIAGLALYLAGIEAPATLDSCLPGRVQHETPQSPLAARHIDLQAGHFSDTEAALIENRLRQLGYVE